MPDFRDGGDDLPSLHDVIRHHEGPTGLEPRSRDVVGVALTNHPARVWLYAADYAVLVANFGQPAWYVVYNAKGLPYVRLKDPETGREATLARILTNRQNRTSVSYVDGDRFNLRRSNLIVCPGSGGSKHGQRRTIRKPFFRAS